MLLDQRPERLLSLSLWVSAQALGVVMASLVDSGGTQIIWLLLLMCLLGSLDEATPPLVVAIQVQISWLSENSSFRNFKFIPKLNQPWSNRWISNLKSPKNLASIASIYRWHGWRRQVTSVWQWMIVISITSPWTPHAMWLGDMQIMDDHVANPHSKCCQCVTNAAMHQILVIEAWWISQREWPVSQ